MMCPHCGTANAEGARFCGACGKATTGTEPQSQAGVAPTQVPLPDLVGKEIAGRYRVLAKLGEGGMGAVYRAEQISFKRTVAVKVLRPEVANSPLLVRRFMAEGEAVAMLSHPNIVVAYDRGQDTDGSLFIAMELIDGKSLRQVIHREAPLSIQRSLAITSQICAALVEAHGRSIIHRDLKPDNVMLQDKGRTKDIVRVLDFGIAKLRDDSRQSQLAMTQAGDMLGTPQYMAPEQIRGEAIDGRTDIYAVGCILYEMITGRLPFEAQTVMAILSKHLMETPLPPSARRPELGIPPGVDNLVMMAMAKDPNARPPTMDALADQVNALLGQLPPESPASAHHLVPPTGQPLVPTPQHATPGAQYAPPRGAIDTPVAPSAYQAPQGPLPHHQTSNPYAPQNAQPQAPYNPHPVQAQVATPPVTKGGNGKLILGLIGLVAVVGAGAGVYFGVVRTSSTPGPVASGSADPFAVPAQNPTLSGTNDPFASGVPRTAPQDLPATPPPADGATVTRGGVTVTLPASFIVTEDETKYVGATDGTQTLAIYDLPATVTYANLDALYPPGGQMKKVQTLTLNGADRPIYRLDAMNGAIPIGGYCAVYAGSGNHASVCVLGAGPSIPSHFDPTVAYEWASRITLSGAAP